MDKNQKKGSNKNIKMMRNRKQSSMNLKATIDKLKQVIKFKNKS